jgi:phospholipid/cholesterol/gamma-HCH transport system substrate-binding protein
MKRAERIGTIAMVITGVITVAIFMGLHRKPFEGGKRTVVADFERAPQLHSGDEVRLEGNIEGKVTKVAVAPAAEQARVTMEIDKSAGEVYADARARVRELTLLGGHFFVEIDRGTKSRGPLGDAVISADRTSLQVEVDDLTDVFREGAYTGLQTMPQELGDAFADSAAPTEAIAAANQAAPDLSTAAKAARGVLPGSDLPKLIVQGARTTSALYSGNDDLRTLVSGAAATLETTGARDREIRQTIDASPSVAYDLDTTLGRLDRTLDLTDGLAVRLQRSAPTLAPALSSLQPALSELDRLLPAAPKLLTQLGLTLDALGRTQTTADALHAFRPTLNRLVQNLADLNKIDPITEKPTSVMIGGTAAGFGGVASIQDAAGHFVRFPASVGASSVYLPCRSSLIDGNAQTLLACDAANEAIEAYLGYLPKGPTR